MAPLLQPGVRRAAGRPRGSRLGGAIPGQPLKGDSPTLLTDGSPWASDPCFKTRDLPETFPACFC